MSLIHPPVLLNSDGCKFRAFGSLEHPAGDLDDLANLFFINNAIEQLLISGFLQVFFSKSDNFLTLNISQIYVVSAEHFLQQMNDVGNGTPFMDVSSLERHEFWSLVQAFPSPYHKLMKRVLVHEFIIITRVLTIYILWRREIYFCIVCKN